MDFPGGGRERAARAPQRDSVPNEAHRGIRRRLGTAQGASRREKAGPLAQRPQHGEISQGRQGNRAIRKAQPRDPAALRELPLAHWRDPARALKTLAWARRHLARCPPTALELFSGAGGLSAALRQDGYLVVEVDRKYGANVLRRSLQARLRGAVVANLFDVVHCGPPCSSFSRARDRGWHSRLRSDSYPDGAPRSDPRKQK